MDCADPSSDFMNLGKSWGTYTENPAQIGTREPRVSAPWRCLGVLYGIQLIAV
jgi:hypothetical protein